VSGVMYSIARWRRVRRTLCDLVGHQSVAVYIDLMRFALISSDLVAVAAACVGSAVGWAVVTVSAATSTSGRRGALWPWLSSRP